MFLHAGSRGTQVCLIKISLTISTLECTCTSIPTWTYIFWYYRKCFTSKHNWRKWSHNIFKSNTDKHRKRNSEHSMASIRSMYTNYPDCRTTHCQLLWLLQIKVKNNGHVSSLSFEHEIILCSITIMRKRNGPIPKVTRGCPTLFQHSNIKKSGISWRQITDFKFSIIDRYKIKSFEKTCLTDNFRLDNNYTKDILSIFMWLQWNLTSILISVLGMLLMWQRGVIFYKVDKWEGMCQQYRALCEKGGQNSHKASDHDRILLWEYQPGAYLCCKWVPYF